jgi:hypothetical protein
MVILNYCQEKNISKYPYFALGPNLGQKIFESLSNFKKNFLIIFININTMAKKLKFFLLLLLLLPNLASADNLSDRLSGKILLQVEANGEAWYVFPQNKNRYYLGRPADAFEIMRKLGLGASNKDFNAWDGTAPLRLAGMIILKVESAGEAFYVNPQTLKLLYMGRPSDAFKLMREQGLGITNLSLGQIIEHDSSKTRRRAQEQNQNQGETQNPEPEQNQENNASSTQGQATSTPTSSGQATSTEETVPSANSGQATSTASRDCEFTVDYFRKTTISGFPNHSTSSLGIDFDWGAEAPDGLGDFKDKFSARLVGECWFEAGDYKFTARYNDGIEATLDSWWLFKDWRNRDETKTDTKILSVTEGYHKVKVEYYDNLTEAALHLDWEKIAE